MIFLKLRTNFGWYENTTLAPNTTERLEQCLKPENWPHDCVVSTLTAILHESREGTALTG
jgi:hypothetical protein